jgi:putative membrane protein
MYNSLVIHRLPMHLGTYAMAQDVSRKELIMEFIVTWIVTSLATMVAIAFVPGITAVGGSYAGPIMLALSLALVNAVIKPVAELLSFPVTFLTLGLFRLVINALMLELASSFSVSVFGSGIQIDSFGSAILGSIVITLASGIIGSVLGAQ